MPLGRVFLQKNSLRDSLVMTMPIVPFASTKSKRPWSFLGACISCKFHCIAYDALLPYQLPLAARIALFHMLASANRKANQQIALAVQVGQSRYVLLTCSIYN